MLYEFKCLQCAETQNLSVPITEYRHDTHAPSCSAHGKMNQIFNNLGLSEAHRNKGVFPYTDENLGANPIVVESQQHRRRLMKEQGLHDRSLTPGGEERRRDSKRKHFSMGKGG